MKTFLCHLIGSLAVVIIFSSGLRGEVRVVEHFDDWEGLTLFKMTVTAAAEPTPALKHRLQLRPYEYKPGNAATYYLRANAENNLSSDWKGVRNMFGDAVDGWYSNDVPRSELPLDDLREAASIFDHVVTAFVKPASLRRDCDWGFNLEELQGPEFYSLPLPGVQQSRSISRLLALRTRLATAEGRYDDAIDHMRMNYRLARNVGQEPLLVCGLVGIAEASVTNGTVIDLIAAPDSPNLYWALSELPTPLVDCREAIRLEMSLGTRIFPELMDAETTEHSPEEWARLFREGIEIYKVIGSTEGFAGFEALGLGLSVVEYPAAKKRLIASGMEESRVEKMSVGQVMMVDAAREYRRIADEVEKWWYVPYFEARVHRYEAEQIWLEDSSPFNTGRTIAQLLMPALQAVRMAQIRSMWKKNALLVIEALRMHAAETGAFPKSLDQIQVVPVPLNPITTEPYLYHFDGETAVLELPFSDGMPGVAYRYEITLAKP